MIRKPKPLPLLVTGAAIALMLSLGAWQLQRLAWKMELINALEQANANAPLEHLPRGEAQLKDKEFYAVRLRGNYMSREFHIAGRYRHSTLGYLVLNPFELEDGRLVLVNRGWVPADNKEPDTREEAPGDQREILAQIRIGDDRNAFTPDNQPEMNIWFGRDVQAMAEHANLAFAPVTLDLIGEVEPGTYPAPTGGNIALRNDHLGYAITWFMLAATILVIFLIYHRKTPGISS